MELEWRTRTSTIKDYMVMKEIGTACTWDPRHQRRVEEARPQIESEERADTFQ